MGYTRPTFKVQGVTFKLKPTSPRNVKELQDYIVDSDIEDPEDDQALEALANQYKDVLRLIAEPQDGTLEDIEPMDIDLNLVDSYLEDFMPLGTMT